MKANITKVTRNNVADISKRFRHYDFTPLIEKLDELERENQSLTDKLKALGEYSGLQTEAEEPAPA